MEQKSGVTNFPLDMTEDDLRKAICEVGKRMYQNRLVSATDGNISVRLDKDRFLCTPSGVSKGFMSPEDLVLADSKGCVISGKGKITTEFFTHLAAYKERPDIRSVCHAHPPYGVACTLVEISLVEPILPEVVMSLGGIPTVRYATPASMEGNIVIRETIRECDALLISRHGAITVGTDPFDAYYRLEKLEHAAFIIFETYKVCKIKPLDPEEVAKLYKAHLTYGGKGKLYKVPAKI